MKRTLWLLAIVACHSDPKTGKIVVAPDAVGRNVAGYVQNARGYPPDVVYGWDLRVIGETAHWRECPSEASCTEIERSRPAAEVLGTHPLGEASLGDAGVVEVVRLTLKSHRRHIMPRSP